jgi:hypothetical protein
MEKPMSDIKKAIFCFEYVERVKSMLIMAAKLVDVVNGLKGDEAAGAKKMMSSVLDAIFAEIGMAQNVLEVTEFEEAGKRVTEADQKICDNKPEDAIRLISEAISRITTSGQGAVDTLREKGLL